ncbi:MAG: YjjG family noncanonical pyrimidine nucleotidase [Ferruginibacter sp.]
MPVYKHIFFDLDHTLWDFDKNAEVALAEVFTRFQLEEKIKDDFKKFYENYLIHNSILWDRYHKGFINAEDLKWKRMWRTLLDFKIADEALAKDMSQAFLEILPTKTELFPHTHEVLSYLNDKGYKLHLITNGFEKTQWSKIKNSGLDKYFVEVITSESSKSVKPNKEIFEYALQKSKATVEESIMIGDNADADIQGAINAGMDCIFVNHIHAPELTGCTYNITHLQQLEDIF